MSKRWAGGIIRGGVYHLGRIHPRTGRFTRRSTHIKVPHLAAALDWLAAWQQTEAGEFHGVREDLDLGTVIRDYLKHSAATNSAKHVKQQARAFGYWSAYLSLQGVSHIEQLSPREGSDFVAWRKGGGAGRLPVQPGKGRRSYPAMVGAAAINRDLAAMKALLTWAERTELIPKDSSPLRSVHLLREGEGINPHRYVEREDILKVRAELEEKWADAVTVLYGTAFRYDSFARMTVGELDARRMVLRDPRPKGKRAVEITVTEEVFDAAKRALGRRYPRDEAQQLGRRLRSACERAGVDRFTAHDLRVSAATWLHEQAGFSVADLQRHLGHADSKTTEGYIRANTRASKAGVRGPV